MTDYQFLNGRFRYEVSELTGIIEGKRHFFVEDKVKELNVINGRLVNHGSFELYTWFEDATKGSRTVCTVQVRVPSRLHERSSLKKPTLC